MMMEVAKVLRLPRKMQLIFLKRHEVLIVLRLPHKTTVNTL
jgi:hypothetical protein